jgi:hypothetical protein
MQPQLDHVKGTRQVNSPVAESVLLLDFHNFLWVLVLVKLLLLQEFGVERKALIGL